MERHVLGRSRVVTRKRSLPEDEPGSSKKPRKNQCHWNMKLVFQKKHFPDIIEKIIEEYTVASQFSKFFALYLQQRARYCGVGFMGMRHPGGIWSIFDTFMPLSGPCFNERPQRVDIQIAKPLEGRMVLIAYSRHGNKTRMGPKRVVYAAQDRMHVDHGPDDTAGGFNVFYHEVESIDIYVEVDRASDHQQ